MGEVVHNAGHRRKKSTMLDALQMQCLLKEVVVSREILMNFSAVTTIHYQVSHQMVRQLIRTLSTAPKKDLGVCWEGGVAVSLASAGSGSHTSWLGWWC